MVEPVTTLAIIGAGIASKETLKKILGPTADYIGGELKNLVEKCNINLGDVFQSSQNKGIENKKGAVPPRIVKQVIEDAAYCTNTLFKDYYGGLLCSSKTEDDEDDNMISYTSILKQLSQKQILTHFLIYSYLYKNIHSDIKSVTIEKERSKIQLIIDIGTLLYFIEDKDPMNWEITLNNTINSLIRHGLIEKFFQYGDQEHFDDALPNNNFQIERLALLVKPTVLGVELFLSATGKNLNPNEFLNKELNLLQLFPKEFIDKLNL